MASHQAKEAESAHQLRDRIADLTSEVQRLQQEMGDAHSADYSTLKRAYVSLVQHFRALQVEAQVLKAHINALDVDVMSPDAVANELTAVAAVAAFAALAGKLLGPRRSQLRVGIWSAGALYLGFRFTVAGFSRMGSLLTRNRQRKRRLQQDWEALTERIRIMDDLTRWEGQDPSLQPPGPADVAGPSSDSGSASASWVDVSPGEEEGRVAYPKPYSPAAAAAAEADDEESGKVSYPQHLQARASAAASPADEEEEGLVSYPKAAAPPSDAECARRSGRGGRGGGQLREDDLPSAPPLPSATQEPDSRKEERQAVPPMFAR